jgi:alkaline phosphatase
LQLAAAQAGKKNIILMVFDGLDWQTTRVAAHYRSGKADYAEGRGTGLLFQDYRQAPTDFGFCVTSPHNEMTEFDVNTQTLTHRESSSAGGYDFQMAGATPWARPANPAYLLGWDAIRYHPVTDSANAASALVTGRKTYNGSINVDVDGNQLQTVAHVLQNRGFSIGIVSNVPISHATPAAAYAHNVSRLDHQDLTRDLLGLPSISHPEDPLPGVDVLLGAGWNDEAVIDSDQGANHRAGNKYLTDIDRLRLATKSGGKYVLAERTAGQPGVSVLQSAVDTAIKEQKRLLGVFGVPSGHLPYRTANGDYQPTDGLTPTEVYTAADLSENPTLADLTRAALAVLAENPKGFWMMVEAGDVDWASHDVNIDNTIGAVLSGEEAFSAITDWVDANKAWSDTAIIVTSDHGHGFYLTNPQAIADAGRANSKP